MSLRQKYVKILSGILPAGVVGVSLLLGSTVPSAANEHPATAQPSASDQRWGVGKAGGHSRGGLGGGRHRGQGR